MIEAIFLIQRVFLQYLDFDKDDFQRYIDQTNRTIIMKDKCNENVLTTYIDMENKITPFWAGLFLIGEVILVLATFCGGSVLDWSGSTDLAILQGAATDVLSHE